MQPRGKETSANAFVSGETRYPAVVAAVGYEGLEGELLGASRDQATLAMLTSLRHQGSGWHNRTLLVWDS